MASYLSGLRPHHLLQAIADYPTLDPEAEPIAPEVLPVQTVLDALIAYRDDLYPHRCPKCGNLGEYAGSRDSGNPADTDKVTCNVCDGWGSTATMKRAVISGYEDVPEA